MDNECVLFYQRFTNISKVTTFSRMDGQITCVVQVNQTNEFSTGQADTKRFSKVEETVLANKFKSDHFTNMSVKLKTP